MQKPVSPERAEYAAPGKDQGVGLKLAISGKGGVGKSTIAAMFAHMAVAEQYRVLAIDADPDANLAAALGMPHSLRCGIVPLSQRRSLIEERTGAKVNQYGQIFKLNPEVSDIAQNESASYRDVHILVLGAVESGGSGCACPESVMLRALLTDVILYKDDCVIVDFEAGLEHLGRATARGVNLLVVVVEPGRRSVETAASIRKMAADIGVTRTAVIGNKVSSSDDQEFLEHEFAGETLLGIIPYDETIRRADRDGIALIDVAKEPMVARFREIWHRTKETASMKDAPV